MAYKEPLKEIKKKKTKISLWDRLLQQDIVRQANLAEFMGWTGLVALLIILTTLWGIKINITVPATEAKLIELPLEGFVVEAVLSKDYASSVSEKQKANLEFLSVQGEKINASGEVIEVQQIIPTLSVAIRVKPDLDMQTLKKFFGNLRSIQLRIIIQRQNLASLFMEKKSEKYIEKQF